MQVELVDVYRWSWWMYTGGAGGCIKVEPGWVGEAVGYSAALGPGRCSSTDYKWGKALLLFSFSFRGLIGALWSRSVPPRRPLGWSGSALATCQVDVTDHTALVTGHYSAFHRQRYCAVIAAAVASVDSSPRCR